MESNQNDVSNEVEVMVCSYQADITYPGQKKFDCGNEVINKFARDSLKKSVRDGNCAAKALIDKKTGEHLKTDYLCLCNVDDAANKIIELIKMEEEKMDLAYLKERFKETGVCPHFWSNTSPIKTPEGKSDEVKFEDIKPKGASNDGVDKK